MKNEASTQWKHVVSHIHTVCCPFLFPFYSLFYQDLTRSLQSLFLESEVLDKIQVLCLWIHVFLKFLIVLLVLTVS